MADTMKLEIVTPEDKIYSDDVNMVTLPAKEGQMGIFPNHVPLMTQVAAGEILAQKGSEQQYLAVGEGLSKSRLTRSRSLLTWLLLKTTSTKPRQRRLKSELKRDCRKNSPMRNLQP